MGVEFLKTVVYALLIAFVFSTLFFRPFHIPSSSMEPALVQGDYIITSKYSLGYGKYAAPFVTLPIKNGRIFERSPKRGDVIVFRVDGEPHHFVKRLVGLPGDKIQMRDGMLWINGKAQHTVPLSQTTQVDAAGNPMTYRQFAETLVGTDKSHVVRDTQIGSRADNTSIYQVPEGAYFFLGDNRDESLDSRYAAHVGGLGMVPASHLVGRAEFILLSVEDGFSMPKPWTWGKLRGNRFFISLR